MQFRARRCAVILEYGPLWKVVRMPYTPYFTLLALRPHPIFQYVGWRELRTQLLMPWRNKVRTPKSLKNFWAPARVASQRSPMFGQPWQSRCRGYFVDSTSFHWSNLAGLGLFCVPWHGWQQLRRAPGPLVAPECSMHLYQMCSGPHRLFRNAALYI